MKDTLEVISKLENGISFDGSRTL